MLCPRMYAKDCEHLIGMVPWHKFRSPKNHQKARDQAKALWDGFDEPYDVDYDFIPDILAHRETSLKYDIVSASSRQMAFYYNVSLPHYKVSCFLEEAVHRYKKFVNLKQANKNMFVVPMYDVDLIWYVDILILSALKPC